MASVTIHAVLNAEALELPELRGLLGKGVKLRVTEESAPPSTECSIPSAMRSARQNSPPIRLPPKCAQRCLEFP